MATRNSIKDYIFYKIFCVDKSVELSYIGSTADWKTRNRSHKNNCNNQNGEKYNYKVYKTIRENGGWSNFKMVEIGKQEQLTLREAEYIEEQYRVELNANMNGRSCFRTEEQKKEYAKEYAQTETGKASQIARSKKWYENNPEYNKEKSKEWRENNPEHTKEYREKYAQTDEAIANRQTPEYKTKHAAAQRNYRAKKKAETAL